MNTHTVKKSDIKEKWYYIDAEDKVLGRLASRIAWILRGKHRPEYSPHLDLLDHVIVVNAEKVYLSGRKPAQKIYMHYTGFHSGLKKEPFRIMIKRDPILVIKQAVKGMLPHNRLGRQLLRKLKVYPGAEHPHSAQKPEILDINAK